MSLPSFKSQLYILLGSILPEALLESMLIPLYPYIVRHLLPDSSDVGHYTGIFSAAFYMPLFLMNIVWGSTSDRIGRKPVLMVGLLMASVSAFLLGSSESYTLSFFARFLAGVFGSNSTVSKSFIGDLATTPHDTAWGYSAYGSIFGFTGIVGPIVSGLMYDPARLYPNYFTSAGFFGSRPYALPCFFGCLLTLVSLYTTQSYLHERQAKGSKYVKKKRSGNPIAESVPLDNLNSQDDDDIDDPEAPLSKGPSTSRLATSSSTYTSSIANLIPSSLLTKKVLGPIFLYCVIAFSSMLYMTAIPIYLSASKDDFGLGLSAQETSICTMLISMVKFPLQVYGFQHYVKYFKSLTSCYQSGMMLLIPVHVILPLIQTYSDSYYTKWGLLTLCMGLIGVAEVLAFLSVIVLITESVTDQLGTGMLGLVHGLASTCSATVRALSPPTAGTLWGQGSAPLVFGFNGFLILVLGLFGSAQF